jgi:chemotaxis family two-component system response regulator Rcp1
MPNRAIRILLVEDNLGDALLFEALLKETEQPIDVHVVSDGEAAIDFLLRRGRHGDAARPDAVILDINLPKKNGLEVLSEIRQQSEFKELPVFMLTGSRSDEDIVKSQALGVTSFITKPSRLIEYEELVKRILEVDLPRVLQSKQDDRF